MSRNRFVQPEVKRLYFVDLYRRDHQALIDRKKPKATAEELARSEALVKDAEADGAFIDVKRQLTAREQRRVFAKLVKEMQAGKTTYDVEMVGFTKLVEYLVGWSFTDDNGPVLVSEDAIDGLDQETYRDIARMIEEHEDSVTKEKEKNRIGGTSSEAISPSAA